MLKVWAEEFDHIPATFAERVDLRELAIRLIDNQPIPGKVTEEEARLSRFRDILKALIHGEMSLSEAYRRIQTDLPRSESKYSGDNRVFAEGWAERLVRTQFSRFYNQAVMEQLLSEGQTQCFVPHSSAEDPSSKCSMLLAGRIHDLKILHNRLVESYSKGNWTRDLKIPDHPHCTHVIKPVE